MLWLTSIVKTTSIKTSTWRYNKDDSSQAQCYSLHSGNIHSNIVSDLEPKYLG